MNIRKNIKTTNIKLTPEISDYLDKRLQSVEKLIDRQDSSAMFDVEIGQTTKHHQTGSIFKAEINLHIAGKQLRASSEEETLFNAIDRSKNEIILELRRLKSKRLRFLRSGGAKIKNLMRAIGNRGARIRNFTRRRK